jgi:hypothetical protein
MHDDLRLRCAHRIDQRLPIKHIDNDRRDAPSAKVVGAFIRSRGARDIPAVLNQQPAQYPADGTGGAGDEDASHRGWRHDSIPPEGFAPQASALLLMMNTIRPRAKRAAANLDALSAVDGSGERPQ